jgi:hypothetical protein
MKMCLIVDPRGSLRASGTGRQRSLPLASELPAVPLEEAFHEAGDDTGTPRFLSSYACRGTRAGATGRSIGSVGTPFSSTGASWVSRRERLPAVWFARDPGCRASYGRLDLKT